MKPSYLRKLSARKVACIRQSAQALFAHLSTLHTDEWVDLLRDLIHHPSQVGVLFNFRFLREAQPSFVACMTAASEQMKGVMTKAADRLVKQARSQHGRRAQRTLEGVLFVGSGLGLPMSMHLLVGIMNAAEVDPQIRLQAGAVLLAMKASPSLHALWQEIRIRDAYFLAPVLVTALSGIDPLRSLHVVAGLPADAIPSMSIEYPIRETLAKLPLQMVDQVAALLKRDFPYKHVIESIMQEPSFHSWQIALAQAGDEATRESQYYTKRAYFGTLDLDSLRTEFPETLPFLPRHS